MIKAIPVLRVFDRDKSIEFYINWLGCTLEWEYADEGGPFYMQVSLRGVVFDLSEHHGECSPGARFSIAGFEGLEAYHAELMAKKYKYGKPGLERVEWQQNTLSLTTIDPFYNRIIFHETFQINATQKQ